MGQVTDGKWGNNPAVRLPGEMVQAINLHDRVEPRVTLDLLFGGKTPDEWRAAYANAYDWGADLGREVVRD